MEQNVSIYYIVETYANNMEWCIELRARDSQKDQDLVQKEPRSLSGSCNCVLTRFSEADRHQPVDGNAHTHTHMDPALLGYHTESASCLCGMKP